MKYFVPFFFLFSFFVFTTGNCQEEEMVVHLNTEEQLIPVSIGSIKDKNPGFSKEYLNEIESVFRFDFDNNGKTEVVVENGALAIVAFDLSIHEHKLAVTFNSLSEPGEVTFGDIHLTGYLNEDRKILHMLHDKIFEYLFDIRGIASSKILYTLKNSPGEKESSEVWESDYDGGNPRAITVDSGYCVTPAYIPPKPGFLPGSFVYTGYKTGQPKIYVASLQEGRGTNLLTLPGNQLMPTVSRQRDQIAFISDVTGNPDLFIQEFDPEKGVQGKPRHLFTSPNATQGSPSFSPDGTRIAFVSNKSGTAKIYVMKIPPPKTPLRDIKLQTISRTTLDNTAPSWSPDGTKIAYCARINGIRQIMVYDFLTGKETQITQGKGNKENPSWASNSLHLTYNTTEAKATELYIINLNQLRQVKISSGKGEKRFPSWEIRTDP